MSCLPLDRRRPIGFDLEGSLIATVTAAEASAEDDRCVVGGVDTHTDTIHVGAVDLLGRELGDREFATTPAGYRDALAFLISFGVVRAVGVEGTSSYGAGLARAARAAGFEVREVIRPGRSVRRRRGKSDPIDAYEAARAVLSERAAAAVKDESVEALRALNNARRSAVKARTVAMNQIQQMLITAPSPVREKYRPLTDRRLIAALAACRPATQESTARAVLTALKALAQRHQYLGRQADALAAQIRDLARAANPHLMSLRGVGPNTAAQLLITAGGNPDRLRSEASFAALCGTAPVPASSGKTTRYRLSRGGDRAANRALYTIALVRMSCDARTREYVRAQRAKGRTQPEILRLLKRAIAREVFKSLTRGLVAPDLADLRPARQAKNITLRAAAKAMNTYPNKILRTERGTFPDYDLAQRYRTWLDAA
jgi:transposase